MPSQPFLIVTRVPGTPARDIDCYRFATAGLRRLAFAEVCRELAGQKRNDCLEVYFEDERPDGVRTGSERWAVLDRTGGCRVDTWSLAEIAAHVYAILREGGFVNPQRNRAIPAPGSRLVECPSGKLHAVLDTMRDELVAYPRPSTRWQGDPWGLPGVTPVVCGGPVSGPSGTPRAAFDSMAATCRHAEQTLRPQRQ